MINTLLDTVAVESSVVAFPCLWPLVPFSQISLCNEEQ